MLTAMQDTQKMNYLHGSNSQDAAGVWPTPEQKLMLVSMKKKYQHECLVYTHYACQTFVEYSDLYLTTDTLILACVFEEFRWVCYDSYKLDCAQ